MVIKFLLVDALNLIRRVYAAQPGEDGPDRVDGALTSTVGSIRRAVRECEPTHAAVVFEGHGPSWRRQCYEGYKAGRTPMPEALKSSLPRFKEAFLEEGVTSLSFPALEADDVIATLASKVASRGGAVVILSTDKTFLQLLSDRIQVRDHFQQRPLNRAFVIDKYGVEPEQFVDFLALTGESTNNIQGVPGIGRKTAATLLREYGTLDQICSESGAMKGKLGERLRKHTEEVRMSQTLVCLRQDLELGLNLKSLRLRYKDPLS